MADAHDGPISQGIRDAIKASRMTSYEVAKRVTQGGRVKLAGPQIYRFLNRKKGLSLAILDEIARVLDVTVQSRSSVQPQVEPISVKLRRPPAVPAEPDDVVELTGDEDEDDLWYHFNFDETKVNEYLALRKAERKSRPYVRKRPNLGLCRTRLFVDPVPDEFQVKLNSLQLPEGFDETGINGKFEKLWKRYLALVNEPGLTPSEIKRANDRHEIERKRIFDEAGS